MFSLFSSMLVLFSFLSLSPLPAPRFRALFRWGREGGRDETTRMGGIWGRERELGERKLVIDENIDVR